MRPTRGELAAATVVTGVIQLATAAATVLLLWLALVRS